MPKEGGDPSQTFCLITRDAIGEWGEQEQVSTCRERNDKYDQWDIEDSIPDEWGWQPFLHLSAQTQSLL